MTSRSPTKRRPTRRSSRARPNRTERSSNVDFSKIAAPIAGKISRSQITVGNLVTANTTILTSIVSVDPIYVYFDIDERTFLTLTKQVREGKLEGRKDQALAGHDGADDRQRVSARRHDRFPRESRQSRDRNDCACAGTFSNPRPAVGERVMESGLFARIRVPIGKPKQALLVDERAIGSDQGRKFLYVVNDKNEVVFRPVELGAMHEGLRVVTEGLSAGERVIIDGLQRVRPGSVVAPTPGEMRSRPGEAIAAASQKAQEEASGSDKEPFGTKARRPLEPRIGRATWHGSSSIDPSSAS